MSKRSIRKRRHRHAVDTIEWPDGSLAWDTFRTRARRGCKLPPPIELRIFTRVSMGVTYDAASIELTMDGKTFDVSQINYPGSRS